MISEQIKTDLIASQKAKDEVAVASLRMLKTAIMNKEIEKREKLFSIEANTTSEELDVKSKLTDEEIIEVVSSEVKKRRDSIASFESGGRGDLAEREKQEVEVLKKYMPAELTEEEVRDIVKEVLLKTGATTIKEIGLVMKEVVPQTKGRADGNMVGRMVREELGGN
ncbi:MAG: GatB/YqeY domain-containing protein [Minisyncoccus archaeiphilus]|uniref:GatB/YqeY domain-containing protein n=1 Tax=Minisyncoccus archaeiphilus TaxID=3238481 RepID=UPI0009C50BF3|nr:MAG: Yqey-like protein [Parcubacteria group bacterium ADurb.Bin216]GMX59729.1 MAG: GatB/YqeY domain-containing protein [Candidatus Parcubacteria bacterium]